MATKEYNHRANSKNYMLRVRLDSQTLQKLDNCVLKTNSNRSEIVRQGIERISNDMGKKID